MFTLTSGDHQILKQNQEAMEELMQKSFGEDAKLDDDTLSGAQKDEAVQKMEKWGTDISRLSEQNNVILRRAIDEYNKLTGK